MSLESKLNCVLIDYRLWAAKSEGRPWVDHCINLYVHHCLSHCLDHHPEPRSGLCPELLADFRIPKPPGCSQGRRGQFSVQSDNRFSGRGGGVGSLPRAWRRVGVPGVAGAKKIREIGVGFSFAALSVFRLCRPRRSRLYGFHTGTRSLSNRKGGRAAKRYVNGNLVEREKGDVWNRNFFVLIDYRLWA